MMNKYNVYIPESSYRKIQKKLQNYEIKIGGMNIRNFLIANSNVDDSAYSLKTRVKRIILHIAGDFDSHPKELDDQTSLEKLNFRHHEYIMLRKRLDQLLKEYDKSGKISAIEVNNCRSVEDCLQLMKHGNDLSLSIYPNS